ncbi:MAG: terminase gpA endonuclease subunit [Lentisphaerota bacterium]
MINPVTLKVREIVGLVNTANTREVLKEPRLRRDRNAAGFRIAGDHEGKTVNLFKYAAWLLDDLQTKPAVPEAGDLSGYERHREQAAQRQSQQSLSGRDIGPLPPVVNPDRKSACARNFRLFCETYYAETFDLEWSDDHLKVIAKIEKSVLYGGLFAIAMPRGSGKTTLAEIACQWAMLYGHRNFMALIGATETAALEMLASIKTEFETNELLLEDFPEVVFPIHCLDGIANRCSGQLYLGKRTRITWTDKEIILPTIEGSVASGKIIRVAGITGRIRGMKFKPSGQKKPVRPDLVIIDDPQDDDSAKSPEQNRKRLRVLAGAILGLAGPGEKISGVMPCTVIQPGDMADEILNPIKHPDWNGERCKMMYNFPSNEKLWSQYAEIRADSLREFNDIRSATEFYRLHRKEMDAGAKVYWPARFEEGELSAIQNAMNLYIRNKETFYAEYQNEPLVEDLESDEKITVELLADRCNGFAHFAVPVEATKITMFIDIHKALLYYMVCAWSENFDGYVIDYGAYPDQSRRYYSLDEANPTLQKQFPGRGLEGVIFSGLTELTKDMLNRDWQREDGSMLKIEKCLIDSAWGDSTDTVHQFCRGSEFGSIVLPSRGVGITASKKPMTEYRKEPGSRLGLNWMIPNVRGRRVIRHALYDTNFWKSFVRQRLLTHQGDAGGITVYGRDVDRHRLLFEHWTAEYSKRTAGSGRVLDEWMNRVGRDNHWFDGIVGCAAAASIQGVNFQPAADVGPSKNKQQNTTSTTQSSGSRVRHSPRVVHRPR